MADNTAGILWAVSAAALSAFTNVLTARPIRQIGILRASLITNVVNVVILALVGWWMHEPGQIRLGGLLWFALLGLTAYSYGRFVFYQGLATIGPSRQMTLMGLAPFLALGLGVFFLDERPGAAVLAGTAFVVVGVVLVSYEPSGGSWFHKGIVWGFASALSFGLSTFIRKNGLAYMPNPALTVAWANLVSVPIILSLRPYVPARLFAAPPRGVMTVLLFVAVLNAGTQILYNKAIMTSDISIVTPILTSSPIFSLIFTALILRDVERVRPLMAAGIVITVGGMLAIALGRG